MNVLCFFNVASVLGHEVVHVTSTPLSIYSKCAGVFLIKLQRQNLDLQLYRKKKFVPRRFSCKYFRTFSASSTRDNVSSLFGKIETLFKRLYRLLSQIILFKTANFRKMLQKVYVVKSVYGKVAVYTMQACDFTKNKVHWIYSLAMTVLNMKHLLEKKLKI